MAGKKKTAKKKATARRPPGPKAHQPTPQSRAVVTAMVSAGVPKPFMAAALGISPATIKRHYKAELESPSAGKGTTALALSTLIDVMHNGETETNRLKAAIFWLRTRENELFSERRINENLDRDGAGELAKLQPHEIRRVAENVLKADALLEDASSELLTKSIDDEPAGHA